MNHRDIAARIDHALRVQPGWDRMREHHFRHLRTGVHVMVFGSSVSVAFGRENGHLYDKAVQVSTMYFPSTAVASAVEVAQALVTVRTLALTEQQGAPRRAGAG